MYTVDISQLLLRISSFRYDDSVLLTSCGSRDANDAQMKQLYFELLDNVICEMGQRFGEKSLPITKALQALCPAGDDWLNESMLLPLYKLVLPEAKFEDLRAELHVGKKFILSHLKHVHDDDSFSAHSHISDVTQMLHSYKEAFPLLYILYASALTFPSSTAVCESSFSTLTRLLTPFRRSMLSKRLSQLSILAFEKDVTNSLSSEHFLSYFRRCKRRLMV